MSESEVTEVTAPAESAGDEWMYLDDDGNPQGPYSSEDMQQWFEAEYFNDDTQVKPSGSEAEYTAVGQMQPRPAFAGPSPAEAAAEGQESEAAAVESVTTEPEVPEKPVKVKYTWFYQSKDGKEQGPWSTKQMKLWHKKGFFQHNDCPVRRHDETQFIKFSLRTDSQFRKKIKLKMQDPDEKTNITPQAEVKADTAEPAAELEEPKWYYLDQDDKEQGPWTSEEMRQWWNANYLAPTVRVRTETETDFVPISSRDSCFTRPKGMPPIAPTPPPQQPQVQTGPQPAPMPRVALPGGNPSFPSFRPPPPFFGGMPRPPMPMMPFNPLQAGGNPLVAPQAPQPQNNAPPADYAQTAAFNTRTGRFQFSGFGNLPSYTAGRAEDNIAVRQHWESKGLAPDTQGRQMGHYFNFDTWQEQQQSKKPSKRARQHL